MFALEESAQLRRMLRTVWWLPVVAALLSTDWCVLCGGAGPDGLVRRPVSVRPRYHPIKLA